MTEISPYRHTEIVRVEECENCIIRMKRRAEIKQSIKEEVMPRLKLIGRRLPLGTLMFYYGLTGVMDGFHLGALFIGACVGVLTITNLVNMDAWAVYHKVD